MSDELLKNVPPQFLEGERAVLGAILLDPPVADLVAQEIHAEHFYKSAHATLYQVILELRNRGEPPDKILLINELKRRGILEAVGGPVEIDALTSAVPTSANALYYAKLVHEKALLRTTLQSLEESRREIFESRDRVEEVLDRIEKRLFQVTQKRVKSEAVGIGNVLRDTFALLEKQKAGETQGIPYGFSEIDENTHGLHKGELVIVAARPSMGKCVASGTEIVLTDGSVVTIDEIVRRRAASLLTLDSELRLRPCSPEAYVDDGEKPVFRVTTRLGRVVETTATHPFLTLDGWRPLGELQPGVRVALPRVVPVFGETPRRECEIKLLAYLIGDGGLTQTSPVFTNGDETLVKDFEDAARSFGGLVVRRVSETAARTPSYRVSTDVAAVRVSRRAFGERLRARVPARGARALAARIGVTPASVTHWIQGKTVPAAPVFGRLCDALGVKPEELAPEGLDRLRKNGNRLTTWLTELGLWGHGAATKFVPDCVFTLPRAQLALFLNRLLATDGWMSVLATGQVQAGYATVSERLARQVQHLLLRFGIVARLRRRAVKYRDERRTAFQLDVTDPISLAALLDEIGIFGKETACERARTALGGRRARRSGRHALPAQVWETVATAKGSESWSSLGRRAGIAGFSNLHAGERGASRERLEQIAVALESEELRALATSDVLWDPIVSIEPLGNKQVYDLTIPETHNFVANDICVHNTTFALNILRNVAVGRPGAKAGHGAVFFSLEMPRVQIASNLLCSMARVNSHKLRGGFLSRDEEESLIHCAEILATQRIFIDDTPGLTCMELRGKARRLKAEGKIDAIIIDYLQLMSGDGGSGQKARHEVVAEISRTLKALARELEVPIVALAQLNRNVEDRPDHRPRMADLRESGSIEQDADVVMLLHRDEYYMSKERAEAEQKTNRAQVLIQKNRNGPVLDVELFYQKEWSYFGELQR